MQLTTSLCIAPLCNSQPLCYRVTDGTCGVIQSGPLSRPAGRVEQMFSTGGLGTKSHHAVARVGAATNPALARHVWRVLRAELLDFKRAQDGDDGFGLDRLEPGIGEDSQLGIGNGRGADGQPAQVA
jgi:hypothetical protein